jgi:serine/threonine-protein kinase
LSKEGVRPGLVLADTGHGAEATAYLQGRLVLFYRVTFAIAVALYVVATFLMAAGSGWTAFLIVHPSRMVHLAGALFVGAGLALLVRRPLRPRQLLLLDAFGLLVAIGVCVSIYAIDYDKGPNSMPAVLSLFVIGRAVVLPSSGRITFLLSLPAPLGLLAVQLAHGEIFHAPGLPHGRFLSAVIWDQLILFLAVAIAAVASHVNYGLRLKVREAMRLGQYRLEERIGAGAMGEVYRASHAMLRRPTAIKVIQPDGVTPDLLRRFEQEVRETSRLSHPNTVAIFDYGRTAEGAFYYAMEYLDGADLRQVVERHGPLEPARVIHLLAQACGALAEAHDAGLVHRDLKPSNLVLCRRGGVHDVVKVVDFGLVKDLAAPSATLTGAGSICGTPETMAPEVLRGEPASPRSDLYAMGVIGYFLLTGSAVFDSGSALDLIGHHLHTAPVPPRERAPGVPADLEGVILRCLAKDPSERFPDAQQLGRALRSCADAGRWTEERAAAWWRDHAKGSGGTGSPQ